MVPDEQGPPVPELARRITLSSCRHDPVPAFTPVLTAMPAAGIPLGDVLADSGYAHRVPGNWASPLRRAGAVLDPGPPSQRPRPQRHPSGRDHRQRQPVLPAELPAPCSDLGPLARSATPGQAAQHDAKTAEAARYKLGQHHPRRPRRLPPRAVPGRHGQDPLPAAPGLDDPGPGPARDPAARRSIPRPAAPGRPSPSRPACSPRPRRNTTTPPAACRRSYARRSGAERGFATAKDPASNDISRGWCRLMGLAPLMLFTTILLDRPQPPHPRRLERPAGRKRPPRRRRPPAQNTAPPPQDPRHPRRRAALDRHPEPAAPPDARQSPQHTRHSSGSMPGHTPRQHSQSHQAGHEPQPT